MKTIYGIVRRDPYDPATPDAVVYICPSLAVAEAVKARFDLDPVGIISANAASWYVVEEFQLVESTDEIATAD